MCIRDRCRTSVSNRFKSRLLTPIILGLIWCARSSSLIVWTSTRTSKLWFVAYEYNSFNWSSLKIFTINKIIDAPARFATSIWILSIIKSLHKTGNDVIFDNWFNRSKLPPKYFSSVNIEIALAPYFW